MSVSLSSSKVQYTTNGSLVDFDFTFGILESSDLTVIYTDPDGVDTTLTETTHYTVTATGTSLKNGGRVTTVATYPSGGKITLMRAVPITQEMDFTEGMPTLYETFEDGLDKLTMVAQQNHEELTRCIIAPASETMGTTLALPSASARANQWLAFDSDGNVITSPGQAGDVPATEFGADLIQCADATEATTLLLSKGTARQVLAMSSDASSFEWVPSPQSVMTASGDLLYASAANTLARLAKGTALQQLMMDASAAGPSWGDSMQSLMTAAGDILYASAANTPARLAKGSAGHHLLMNAAGTAPSWIFPFKMGSFSRVMDAASGNVSYTGVGFKPNAMLFVSANATLKSFSMGLNYASDSTSLGLTINWTGTATAFSTSNDLIRLIQTAGSKEQTAVVASLDSDGFTLTWTKTGTPASTTVWIWYMAWR